MLCIPELLSLQQTGWLLLQKTQLISIVIRPDARKRTNHELLIPAPITVMGSQLRPMGTLRPLRMTCRRAGRPAVTESSLDWPMVLQHWRGPVLHVPAAEPSGVGMAVAAARRAETTAVRASLENISRVVVWEVWE